MFEVAESYEAMMRRWSRQLAPLFVEFVGVRNGEKILDAGCGSDPGPSHRSVEDRRHRSFQGIVGYARSHVTDPRVIFELGDAQDLSYTDESFDRCMALLIVNFIPDAPKAAKEMRRVTKSGGVVATTMWDGSGANELNALLIGGGDPDGPDRETDCRQTRMFGSAAALSDLWNGVGLTDIEDAAFAIHCQFSSFDDYWLPLTKCRGILKLI